MSFASTSFGKSVRRLSWDGKLFPPRPPLHRPSEVCVPFAESAASSQLERLGTRHVSVALHLHRERHCSGFRYDLP